MKKRMKNSISGLSTVALLKAVKSNNYLEVVRALENVVEVNIDYNLIDVTISNKQIHIYILNYALLRKVDPRIIQLLIEKGANINQSHTINGLTSSAILHVLENNLEEYIPAFLASYENRLLLLDDSVMYILEYLWLNQEKYEANKFSTYIRQLVNKLDLDRALFLLTECVQQDKVDFMRFLMEKGVNPFQKTGTHPENVPIYSPFYTVCAEGSVEMLQAVLQHPQADIDQEFEVILTSGRGRVTGLMAMILSPDNVDPQKRLLNIEKAKLLISKKANLFYVSPLETVKIKKVKQVKMSDLSSTVNDIACKDIRFLSPAILAIESEQEDFINLIFGAIRASGAEEEKIQHAFGLALVNLMLEIHPNKELIMFFKKYGYDINSFVDYYDGNSKKPEKYSALSFFVSRFSFKRKIPFDLADMLLASGANISDNSAEHPFVNPLRVAFLCGSVLLLDYLLSKGADPLLLESPYFVIRSTESFTFLLKFLKEKRYDENTEFMQFILSRIRTVVHFEVMLKEFPELFAVTGSLYLHFLYLVIYENKQDFFKYYLTTSNVPANLANYSPFVISLNFHEENPNLLLTLAKFLNKLEFKKYLKKGMQPIAAAIAVNETDVVKVILDTTENPSELITNLRIEEEPAVVFSSRNSYMEMTNLLISYQGVMEAKIQVNCKEIHVGSLVADTLILQRNFSTSHLNPAEVKQEIVDTFKNINSSLSQLPIPSDNNLKQQDNVLFQLACFFETLCIYQASYKKDEKFMLADKLTSSIRNHLMHHYMLLNKDSIVELLINTKWLIQKYKKNTNTKDNSYWMSLNKPFIEWNIKMNQQSATMPAVDTVNSLVISHALAQLEDYQQQITPSSIFDRGLVNACALHLKVLGERYQQNKNNDWGEVREDLERCHSLRSQLGHEHGMMEMLYNDIVPWAIFSEVNNILQLKGQILECIKNPSRLTFTRV